MTLPLRAVRLALLRMADEVPIRLGGTKLAKLLMPGERDKLRRGQRLQEALRGAIDRLAPIGTRADSERWVYLIYIGEYEEGKTRGEMQACLAISPSTYTRAKLAGLNRIVAMLPYLILESTMTMDDAAWMRFLDTLTERERYVVQGEMARMGYILNKDRILEIEDFQHQEDNTNNLRRQVRAEEVRQDDADARMDRDEEQARQQADAIHALFDRVTELEHPQ